MASKNDITGFEITSHGNVKIRTYRERGETTHEYWSVPKEIIKKLVNASKAPTLKDFDDWVNEYRKKQEDKYDAVPCGSSDWWSS